jgi:hypothetical protein
MDNVQTHNICTETAAMVTRSDKCCKTVVIYTRGCADLGTKQIALCIITDDIETMRQWGRKRGRKLIFYIPEVALRPVHCQHMITHLLQRHAT